MPARRCRWPCADGKGPYRWLSTAPYRWVSLGAGAVHADVYVELVLDVLGSDVHRERVVAKGVGADSGVDSHGRVVEVDGAAAVAGRHPVSRLDAADRGVKAWLPLSGPAVPVIPD